MKADNQHIALAMADALHSFLKTMSGQRLDKRSVTAGFYAAAALIASAANKDAELVDLFTTRGSDAIERRNPAPIASGVPFDGRKS